MLKNIARHSIRSFAAFILSLSFIFYDIVPVFAQSYLPPVAYMPKPGVLLPVSQRSQPLLMRGVTFDPRDPLRIEFVISRGDRFYSLQETQESALRMAKYFLAGITIPSSELWVNLSPFESERIATEDLAVTDLGRDLLGEDYVLKQFAASLTYPETQLGKKFWDKVYADLYKLYGTSKIPVNSFSKVWIVPGKIKLYEDGDKVFVAAAPLEVMTEQDYLAASRYNCAGPECFPGSRNVSKGAQPLDDRLDDKTAGIAAVAMREIIIPAIKEEVNNGSSFAYLRQAYYSLVLASWFKGKLRATVYGNSYVGKGKIKGIEGEDLRAKDKIYAQYLEAYRQGVYNYQKRTLDPSGRKLINRQYYCGGFAGQPIDGEVAGAQRLPGTPQEEAQKLCRFRRAMRCFCRAGYQR